MKSTLLEVRPATASDEQRVPSESHALVLQHQRHTTIRVSRGLSHRQILAGGKDTSQLRASRSSVTKTFQLKITNDNSSRIYRMHGCVHIRARPI